MNRDQQIVEQFKAGTHAAALAQQYNISTRQVQRIVKAANASRTISESYKLAIEQGRMTYLRKPKHMLKHRTRLSDKMRYKVLKLADFRCSICGITAKDCFRLEVDHVDDDPTNHAESNLQALCDRCNKGKAYNTT